MLSSDVCLSDVCLTSVCRVHRAQVENREADRGRQKIGAGVAHVTHDSDTTFKVKRLKVKVIRPLYSWERIGRVKLLLRCDVLGGARRFGTHRGRRGAGAYRGGRPPTACYYC